MILEDLNNELWLSPISLWEIIILEEKGRITLNMTPQNWIETVLKKIPFREAPLNFNVAMASRSISLPHQDPADRFLAATAKTYNLTLVTADRHLLKCKDIHLLKNE